MAYGTAIKRGFQIAGRIDQKYNLHKIFIQKYAPPGYRKTLNKIVDIAGTLGGGYGIYRFITSFKDDNNLNGGNGFPTQKKYESKTSKS